MEKFLLQKQDGHAVPCIAKLPAGTSTGTPDGPRKLVIVVHGYDSSKESENAANLMRILPEKGFGVFAYDQPHHGTEEAAEEELTVENCLDSLAKVEEYLTERFPVTEICYFGSSFGAYILGIYLTTRPHKGRKAFMRCAAVNFPELAEDEGVEDADLPDLFELFDRAKPEDVEMAFAHGECDSTVPVSAAVSFAERYGYPITVFPGEEHPICTYPENPGKVAQLAVKLYNGGNERNKI